jgi:hypothetical protein
MRVRNTPTAASIVSSLKTLLSVSFGRGVSSVNPFKNHIRPSLIRKTMESQVTIPILDVMPEYSTTAVAAAIRMRIKVWVILGFGIS